VVVALQQNQNQQGVINITTRKKNISHNERELLLFWLVSLKIGCYLNMILLKLIAVD
jgi:hypothetical protein